MYLVFFHYWKELISPLTTPFPPPPSLQTIPASLALCTCNRPKTALNGDLANKIRFRSCTHKKVSTTVILPPILCINPNNLERAPYSNGYYHNFYGVFFRKRFCSSLGYYVSARLFAVLVVFGTWAYLMRCQAINTQINHMFVIVSFRV